MMTLKTISHCLFTVTVSSLFLCCIVLEASYIKAKFGIIYVLASFIKVVFGNICTSLISKGCFRRLLVASCNAL